MSIGHYDQQLESTRSRGPRQLLTADPNPITDVGMAVIMGRLTLTRSGIQRRKIASQAVLYQRGSIGCVVDRQSHFPSKETVPRAFDWAQNG